MTENGDKPPSAPRPTAQIINFSEVKRRVTEKLQLGVAQEVALAMNQMIKAGEELEKTIANMEKALVGGAATLFSAIPPDVAEKAGDDIRSALDHARKALSEIALSLSDFSDAAEKIVPPTPKS